MQKEIVLKLTFTSCKIYFTSLTKYSLLTIFKMISKHFLILFFLFIGSTTFAQKGMITGKAVDAQTGLPLEGSTIF